MRGDRPIPSLDPYNADLFTPHARGSTATGSILYDPVAVYPACAGIDLPKEAIALFIVGLPRMRGDRPMPQSRIMPLKAFTPHARGSTTML